MSAPSVKIQIRDNKQKSMLRKEIVVTTRKRTTPYRRRSVTRLAQQIIAADGASFKRYRKSRKRLVRAPVMLNKREVNSYGRLVRKVSAKRRGSTASSTSRRRGNYQDSTGRWHSKSGKYTKAPSGRTRRKSSAAASPSTKTRRSMSSFYRSRGY